MTTVQMLQVERVSGVALEPLLVFTSFSVCVFILFLLVNVATLLFIKYAYRVFHSREEQITHIIRQSNWNGKKRGSDIARPSRWRCQVKCKLKWGLFFNINNDLCFLVSLHKFVAFNLFFLSKPILTLESILSINQMISGSNKLFANNAHYDVVTAIDSKIEHFIVKLTKFICTLLFKLFYFPM